MRKIALTTPSVVAITALGLEDAEIAPIEELQNADDLKSDMEDDFKEAELASMEALDLLQRVAALEDIAEVIETQVQEARPSDVVLVDIATDLATEGTDLEDGDVTPGLESAVGGQISTEGIVDAVGKFMSAIVDRVGKMFDKIGDLFGRVGSMVSLKKRELKEMALKVDAMGISSGSVTIGKKIKRLCVDGKVPGSPTDIAAALKSINKDYDLVSSIFLDLGHDFTTKIVSAFTLKGNKVDLSTELAEVIKEFAPKYTNVKGHGVANYRNGGELITLVDYGDVRVASGWNKVLDIVKSGSNAKEILKAVYNHGYFHIANTSDVIASFGKDVKSATTAEIQSGDKKQLHDILNVSLEIIEKIGKSIPKLNRTTKDGKYVADNYSKFSWSPTTRRNQKIGHVCAHNTGFPAWHSITASINSVEAALIYVERSISVAGKSE